MAKGKFTISEAKRKKQRIARIIIGVAVFLLVALLIVFLFSSQRFKIKTITVQGNVTLATEKIVSGASGLLKNKSLGFIPLDSYFALPKKEIIENLESKFRRIKTVSVSRKMFSEMVIKINERTPTALYCLDKKCSFVDEEGFAFEIAPYFSNTDFVKIYSRPSDFIYDDSASIFNDIAGQERGEQIMSVELFQKIMRLKDKAEKEKIKIVKAVFEKEKLYKIYSSEGWFVLLKTDSDMKMIFENLLVALREIGPSRLELEYLDLRLPNKVFYKFK